MEQALEALGEVLEHRGVSCDVVVIGGGALQLLGLITRPTKDLDVVAFVRDGKLEGADPFPVEPGFLAVSREALCAFGVEEDDGER